MVALAAVGRHRSATQRDWIRRYEGQPWLLSVTCAACWHRAMILLSLLLHEQPRALHWHVLGLLHIENDFLGGRLQSL